MHLNPFSFYKDFQFFKKKKKKKEIKTKPEWETRIFTFIHDLTNQS